MKVLLGFIGILAFLGSLGSCAMAKTVVHEVGALVLLLVGVVAVGLASVIEELQGIAKRLESKDSKPLPTLMDATSEAPRPNPMRMAGE
jgi:hypothetical protein